MLKHIITKKQDKQKDLKAEKERKEKQKFRLDTSKKSSLNLIFDHFPQSKNYSQFNKKVISKD